MSFKFFLGVVRTFHTQVLSRFSPNAKLTGPASPEGADRAVPISRATTILRRVQRLLALGASCAVLLLNGTSHAVATITTVDSGSSVDDRSSVQLNASGFAVISYFDAIFDDLKLAVCNNAACTSSTLTTVDSAAFVGQFSSLKLNASGFPVISYYDATNGDLKLATCLNVVCTSLTLVTVASTDDVGQYTSLQLDASGLPVISYYDVTNGDLKLARCEEATCSIRSLTTVDSTGDVGRFTSLQLSASGFPVISYIDQSNLDLKLAVCNNADCTSRTITTVDAARSASQATSLRLNAQGFPVISYFVATGTLPFDGDLMLAVCGDVNCAARTTIEVDNAYTVGRNSSLALSASGFPIISYYDLVAPSALKLAVCHDANCTSRTLKVVDNTDNPGVSATSLQLNASGLPVISYRTGENYDLRLATFSALTVTSVAAPVNANYTTGQSLFFSVNWSEPVTVTGTPALSLTVGGSSLSAGYFAGSGTTELVFRYTVQAGHNDNDGISIVALSFNGGRLSDEFGLPANVTLNNVPSTNNVFVNRSFTVTPSAGPNGSIAPNAVQNVASGATTAFTVTPNPGFVATVGGTCGGTLSGNTYTTNVIAANCTVTASFAPIACRLDINDDAARTPELDGLLILRYLLGFRGAGLMSGLPSPLPGNRNSVLDIEEFLGRHSYNVRGLAQPATAPRDGLVMLRYLQSQSATAMIAGTDIAPADASAVLSRIQSWCP
jgi:trimeric autotransporter adhesin